MYRINSEAIDAQKSYATESNALRAIEKAFGPQDAPGDGFTVLLARNSAGRVVPIVCNIAGGNVFRFAHKGFFAVN